MIDPAYVHPEVLVSTQWVEEHRSDTQQYRIVESDEDILLYNTGHIPEAVRIDWVNDLQDLVVRDYITADRFAALLAEKGIGPETTVVFYGDKSNWWACYAFWAFRLLGHRKCLIMDGGRKKWVDEKRAFVTDREPRYSAPRYLLGVADPSIRAYRDDVLRHLRAGKPLVDVRSPGEYSGELLHMPEYPQEGSLRTGHIPTAKSVPWSLAVHADGTFRSAQELKDLYLAKTGLKPTDDLVVYCRIGERSALTWFVLVYLLGFKSVRNYDGSWTEWGNLVGVPIERSVPPKRPG